MHDTAEQNRDAAFQWIADNYQSEVADGVLTTSGKVLQALHAPGVLWATQTLSPKVKHDPNVSDEKKEALTQALFARSMVVLSMLEGATGQGGNDHTRGFHSAQFTAIQQIVAIGDVLQRLDDDYQITDFTLDQYVTQRDSTGRVLRHVVKERYDPATLTPGERSKAEISDETLAKLDVDERLSDVFERIEWQPITKQWTITRELLFRGGGAPKVIGTRDEKISPYFSTPYHLPPGADYGDSRIMLYMGDCSALDFISCRELDFAFLASWFKLFIEESWNSNEGDIFNSRNGSVHRGPLRADGSPAHIGLFKADKVPDFTVVEKFKAERVANVRRAFLSDTGHVRQSERTTAFEVARTAIAEVQGKLGGVYATMADSLQRPLFERAMYQCVRDRILMPLPEKGREGVKTEILTGLNALAAQSQFQNIASLVEIAKNLGPRAQARINDQKVLNLAVRALSINEPGLILTEAEAQAKFDEAMKAQLRLKAGERAIDAAGTIAESQPATPAGT